MILNSLNTMDFHQFSSFFIYFLQFPTIFSNFQQFSAIFINFQQFSTISNNSQQVPSNSVTGDHPLVGATQGTLWLGQRKRPSGWGSASDPLVDAAQATLRLWKKFIENFRPGNNSKTILENFEQLSKGKFL